MNASPSAELVSAASRTVCRRDKDGREITVRRLTALDRLRLFKAIGPALAQNHPYLGMAMLAASVTMIDDVPVPPPVTEQQIEALVAKLGEAGIAVAADVLSNEADTSTRNDSRGN